MQLSKIYWLMTCVVALFALSGCFSSSAPLISVAEADFPFERISYQIEDDDDRISLERGKDGYFSPAEKGDGKLLLKSLGDNVYVLQVEVRDDERGEIYLYALARLADDKASFQLFKTYATTEDRRIVGGGRSGLKLCGEDGDTVCVANLGGYIEYARHSMDRSGTNARILALE